MRELNLIGIETTQGEHRRGNHWKFPPSGLAQVQVFPVIKFNPSSLKVEPIRGKWAIEPISKQFYYMKVQSVPAHFELIRGMNH